MVKQIRRLLLSLILFSLGLGIQGCARYRPNFDPGAAFYKRVESQEQKNVKVSIAGLGAKESRETFGVGLASKGILPLWVRIENNDPSTGYFFAQRSMAEKYFAPSEAAYISRTLPGVRWFQGRIISKMKLVGVLFSPLDYFLVAPANKKMDQEFRKRGFQEGWIKAGEKREGFIFVPNEMGSKDVSVDLFSSSLRQGKSDQLNFSFMIDIPGIRQDYLSRDFDKMYPAGTITDIQDLAELKKALESLPCCVTNKKGDKNGDTVNLVIIGTLEELLTAFTSAKWDETEIVYFSSLWKMFTSVSKNKKYLYSPVSPLYLYGRSHDLALQKARETINERMHLRLWYSPFHFQGKPVWVGGVSRDIGVRWTTKTWNLMTHKIDPDLDASMLYVLMDLFYSKRVQKYGFVGGIPSSTLQAPARNLTGDIYYTKGKRVVIAVSIAKNHEFPTQFGIGNYAEDSEV